MTEVKLWLVAQCFSGKHRNSDRAAQLELNFHVCLAQDLAKI